MMNEILAYLRTIDVNRTEPHKIFDLLVEHFPTATTGEKYRAIETMRLDAEARLADKDRELAEFKAKLRMFEGLPKGIKFLEACSIKAAQGDRDAQEFLRQMKSPEHRRQEALAQAAAIALGFQPDKSEPGVYSWPGPGKPPVRDVAGLVDWFERAHPREARAVAESVK